MFLSLTFDTLSAFFLICFGVGLLMSILTFLIGGHHAHGSDFHGGGADLGHDLSHGAGQHGECASWHGHGGYSSSSDGYDQLSTQVQFFNLNTMLAFLLGFGGAGFLLQDVFGTSKMIVWFGALAGGFCCSYLVYVALKFLLRHQSDYLKPSDFDIRGIEADVTSTIFEQGLGEISYILQGRVGSSPAKSFNGEKIEKGRKVVVREVEGSVAVVMDLDYFKSHY